MGEQDMPMASTEEVMQMLQAMAKLKATNEQAYQEAVKAMGLEAVASLVEEAMKESEENELKDLKIKPSAKDHKTSDNVSLNQLTEALNSIRGNQELSEADILKLGKEKQAKGIYITPTAGFSYKTIRTSDQQKVFINITQHENIDKPSIKKKLDAEGNEVEGMNIPMSVGNSRVEKDKKGQECTVYDIVVNPDVIHDIEEDATGKFREFICQLGIQSIEQKYKDALDKRYKIPKLQYMGDNIPKQYIQDRKNMPQIEEVTKSTTSKSQSKNSKSSAVMEVVEPDKELSPSLFWVVDSSSVEETADIVLTKIRDDVLNASSGLEVYDFPFADYVDPVELPPVNCRHLLLTMELQSYEIKLNEIQLATSPFKLTLKLPGYKKITCYLAAAVMPSKVKYSIRTVEGYVSLKKFEVILPLDGSEWDLAPDAGSKPWLVAQALSDDGSDGYSNASSLSYKSNTQITTSQIEGSGFAEDKFHLNLPANVDPYTGLTLPDEHQVDPDTWELPEDRFHQKDAASSFILEQRDQTKKEKWEKFEKEKAEREKDPNVEYVDMDDFRPGGKYGPKTDGENSAANENEVSTDVAKASAVLAEMQKPKLEGVLSSNLWTELLD